MLALLAIGTTALAGSNGVPWLIWLAVLFYVAALVVFSWPWLMRPGSFVSLAAEHFSMQPTLVSLLEFRSIAEKRGWDLSGRTQEAIDLGEALNEAGIRGYIEFSGRPVRDHIFEDLIRSEPRTPIIKEDWSNLQLDGSDLFLNRPDNFLTSIIRKQPFGAKVYVDIHLDRVQTLRWLKTHAKDYKGRRDAINASKAKGTMV